MLDTLRSGDWLTPSRMRLWAIAVLVASVAGTRLARRDRERPE